MQLITLLLFNFYFIFPTLAETDTQVKKFEDLFIWKISDELKLTPKEEAVVSLVIKESNQKKAASNSELEGLYKKLKNDTLDSSRKVTFNKIRATLKTQLAITLDELDRLNKGMGLKKLGQYLELKRDLSEKIKAIWIQNEKKGSHSLPPPKVIEEK